MAKRDYYDILGIDKGADAAAIKSAYRKMAMKYHPDKNPDDKSAEAKFKEASEAYEILKDEQKRAAYDQYGHAAFEGGMGGGAGGFGAGGFAGGGFSDIFEEVFGDFMGGGGRGRGRRRRGSDKKFNLQISLEDAFNGRKVEVKIPTRVACSKCDGSGAAEGSKAVNCQTCGGQGKVRMQQGFFTLEQTCPTCRGEGTRIDKPCGHCQGKGWEEKNKKLSLSIPMGIEDGQRIRLAGEGDIDDRGVEAGDLYIFISISPHHFFERDGKDLYCALPLSMVDAAMGKEIEVPTIDGGRARLKIPAGTQAEQSFRLKGKGMPIVNTGGRRGDMYLRTSVEIPVNLTDRQKELLTEFAEEGKNHAQQPKSTNFFDKVKEFFDN
jgi:molecular chaperone DnaJ